MPNTEAIVYQTTLPTLDRSTVTGWLYSLCCGEWSLGHDFLTLVFCRRILLLFLLMFCPFYGYCCCFCCVVHSTDIVAVSVVVLSILRMLLFLLCCPFYG